MAEQQQFPTQEVIDALRNRPPDAAREEDEAARLIGVTIKTDARQMLEYPELLRGAVEMAQAQLAERVRTEGCTPIGEPALAFFVEQMVTDR